MKKLIVDSKTGVILHVGHEPYPDGVEIDRQKNPYPDGNFGSMTHKWDFETSSWVEYLEWKLNKKSRKKLNNQSRKAKKEEYIRIKALVDDNNTDWSDPTGELLKSLYEGFESILRKDA